MAKFYFSVAESKVGKELSENSHLKNKKNEESNRYINIKLFSLALRYRFILGLVYL